MNTKTVYYIYQIHNHGTDPVADRKARLIETALTRTEADWHAGIIEAADKYIGPENEVYPRAEVREVLVDDIS